MRIREWQDILQDVIDSGDDPDGWRAAGGDRAHGPGEDLYFGHPSVGVYHIKTYARNPFTVEGVGTRVARRLDDEIGSILPAERGTRFAVQSAPADAEEAEARAKHLEETIEAHADAPTTPDALFEDVMNAIESPAFGPMEYDGYDRPESLDRLAERFEEAETVLDAELDELIATDEVDRGFQ